MTTSNIKDNFARDFYHYIPEIKHQDFAQLFNCSEDENLEQKFLKLRREEVLVPHFLIGTGTCGRGAGAYKTYERLVALTNERQFKCEITLVGCIGLCSEEPLVDMILPHKNRLTFSQVTEDKVTDLLDHKLTPLYQWKESGKNEAWANVPFMDEHPFFRKQMRFVLANCGVINPLSIEEYLAAGGYQACAKALNQHTPHELCDMVMASGLRGRGGGGFLTGKKWKFALETPSDERYLICNADEGDPGAFMDRAVIEGDPHRLLEGIIIAAYAIRAHKAYVYTRAEYPLAISNLAKAIADAKEWGFLGENILDSNFNLEVIIKKGAGAFVCGEETALIHSIEGKRGMPRLRPPFPAIKGLYQHPTIINNVETLANVGGIISKGPEWFGSVGTQESKGTKVFALSGKILRTGLVEVPMGISIREIVFDIGGGIPKGKKYKAVQIGGPSGGCIPTSMLDIKVDYESLKTIGAMMGSGGLVVMDEDNCMVDVAKFFMDFIQRESCGKCIPCREGTKRMLTILEQIIQGYHTEKGYDALNRFQGIMQLEELAHVLQETSLCGLGQSAANPVLSTLRWFREEYEQHIFRRTCPSKVCSELIQYKINEDKCTGCTLCSRQCPVDAIVSEKKMPHTIIEEKCIRCGVCFKVCRLNAVEML